MLHMYIMYVMNIYVQVFVSTYVFMFLLAI